MSLFLEVSFANPHRKSWRLNDCKRGGGTSQQKKVKNRKEKKKKKKKKKKNPERENEGENIVLRK